MDSLNQLNAQEMEVLGYNRVYDYTQYSHDNHVNVIPEESFKRLVSDTFKTITDTLRSTYGPYGSTMIISDQNETTTTKDGYNVFEAMNFNHHYKHMVYLAIGKICERVNRNVGDGTTSCILLAEKMFNALNKRIQTPDDKREILSILNDIEKRLQSLNLIDEDKMMKKIQELTVPAFENLVMLAGNYDKELVHTLYVAMLPTYDEHKVIESIRNVIVDTEVNYDGDSTATYAIDYLPGDYRVRVDMGVEIGLSIHEKTDIKIALYDHAFGHIDWVNFMQEYDKETPTLILARKFTNDIINADYKRYIKDRELVKRPTNILIAEVKGDFIQNEIADLGALLNTNVNGVNASTIKHEELPTATVQLYKGNCLCFYDVKPPTKHIDILRQEMDKDLSGSHVKRQNYIDRIKALSLESKDTLVTVKAGTSLEINMLKDKIDDCVSIVNSAITHGIVPNLLIYGYSRIKRIAESCDNVDSGDRYYSLMSQVAEDMSESIEGLFSDIWISKYGNTDSERYNDVKNKLFSGDFTSYDIVNDEFVDIANLPTSSQYDLEVIVAAISIVKYLLTSRALIFDSYLMRPQGDEGHFQL
jgi:hypothetical protein